MTRAGRLISDGLSTMRDEFWMVWLSNLLWLVLMIPIITIPLAFAGLFACAHNMAHGKPQDWKSFFTGVKQYLGAALRWTGANVLVLAVMVFYIWFFSAEYNSTSSQSNLLANLFLVIALLWSILNMYTFPFMLVQEKPSYLNALRNTTVLFIKWPTQAILFSLFNLIVIGFSVWLRIPWLVFGASLPALMACLCVKDVVEQTGTAGMAQS